jgi:hypothetical protein
LALPVFSALCRLPNLQSLQIGAGGGVLFECDCDLDDGKCGCFSGLRAALDRKTSRLQHLHLQFEGMCLI